MSTRTETETVSGTPGCCCVGIPDCPCNFRGCVQVTSVTGMTVCECVYTTPVSVGTWETDFSGNPLCPITWGNVLNSQCGFNFNGFDFSCNTGGYIFSPSTSFTGTPNGVVVVSVQASPFKIVIDIDSGFFCDVGGEVVTVTIEEVPCP